MPKQNPFNQYKETQVSTANQGKLIVMLYDGAIKFMNIAIENMDPKTYDVVNNNIIRAADIITELLVSLNMKEGGEVSSNLFNLYMYFKKRLLQANIEKKSEILQEVIKNMTELRNAWDKISGSEARTDRASLAAKGSFSIEG